VGLGEDIGIDAQGEARLALAFGGAAGKQGQLRFALDVEGEDFASRARSISSAVFADAGEDDAPGSLRSGGEHALQFAAGDDVEARALGWPAASEWRARSWP
jgi:hypothetical protein